MASVANAAENPEQGINAENLFPLDAPEFAVRFRNGAKIVRHIFRRMTAADWGAYYDNLIVEDTTENDGRAESISQDTASLILYQRTILRVEGYGTRDGRSPETLPTWPDCIPQEHRLFAIGLLQENREGIAEGTFQVGADGKSVSFVIVRDESEFSAIKQFFGVTHHFRAPMMGHHRRFLCARSEFPSSTRTLTTLYDELAVSAEGYSVGGAPIAPEQLQSWMTFGHKLYAVAALLLSFGDCDPEPRKVKPFSLPADLFGVKTATPATRGGAH